MYKHEQHHITPSSEGHKNDIQRRSTVGSRCMNYEPMGKSLRVNHKPVCARPRPTIHFINTNFMSQTGYRSIKFGIEALFQARELGIYARELGIHARKLGVHVLAQIADFAAHISKALFHVATYIYNILFRRNV